MKVYKNARAREHILKTYDRLLGAWETEVQEMDIPTAFGTTHVVACGDKHAPPLVLFHGVGDDSALMWLYNARALSSALRVFAVDTLGGPGKSRPNEKYGKGFSSLAWMDELMAGLAPDGVFLAGVSNGAYLAQLYGAYRPRRVKKILCMAGTLPVGSAGPLKTMMRVFLPEALLPTEKNVAKLLRKLSGQNSGVFTENPLVMEHYTWLLKGFNNMTMRFHSLEHFSAEQIDAIRDKTRFLVGEADPFAMLGGLLVNCTVKDSRWK